MEDKLTFKQVFLATIIFSCFAFVFFVTIAPSPLQTVSATTESSTTSNASVAVTIGFTFSGNLSEGITFGSVSVNTDDNNATSNYIANVTGGCDVGNCTAYYISMDSANNAGSDTCISDNVALTFGATTIANTGYTYDANASFLGINMAEGTNGATAITTSYALFGDTDLDADANQTMQFYLDVPSGQTAGDYNNTLNFKIVQTGAGC